MSYTQVQSNIRNRAVKEDVMRDRLRLIAEETVAILERGWYDHPEAGRVTIADDLARSVAATRLWTPEDAATALSRLTPAAPATATRVEVTNEASLAAARRLAGSVGCLNFASAKNPGGGFLRGAEAQEESLARSSGLYHCLLGVPGFYSFHRSRRDLRYSDHVIFSPAVPVFRDEEGALLARPYPVSFVTAAAPNAGALGPGHPQAALLPEVLAARTAKVLAVFCASGMRRLVLGAWGCGVFRNPPASVAAAFAEHLGPSGVFHSRFEHVVFAVLDHAPGAPTFAAFARAGLSARHGDNMRERRPSTTWRASGSTRRSPSSQPSLRPADLARRAAPEPSRPDAAGCCHAYPCCLAARDQRRRS
jgi:uncharacterized protein (TIGR02452 family)